MFANSPNSLTGFLFSTILSFVFCNPLLGQFDTIFNVPPALDPQTIGSNTQLNVFADGEIGAGFVAGNPDGSSTNIQVNVFDGTVGGSFTAHPNTELNLLGGFFGSNLVGNEIVLNVGGDAQLGESNSIQSFVSFFSNSTINIFDDAAVRNLDVDNCTVNVWSGSVTGGFDFSGLAPSIIKVNNSLLNVYGGVIGPSGFDVSKVRICANGHANYFGGVVGTTAVFGSGTLNIYDDADVQRVLLQAGTSDIAKSRFNMFGGVLDSLEFVFTFGQDPFGGQAFLYDGRITSAVRFSDNHFEPIPKFIEINGVDIEDRVLMNSPSGDTLKILNGFVENLTVSPSDNSVYIFGGTTQSHRGDGNIQLYGSEFQLLDAKTQELILDITPLVQFGTPFLVEQRDVILRAVLADGSLYEQTLATTGSERFEPNELTVHLSQELSPVAFQLLRGVKTGGAVAELSNSDDKRLSIQPGFTLNPAEPPVWLSTDLNTPVTSPANLRLMVEANASTFNLRQIVEVRNWNTGEFERPLDHDFEASFMTDRLRVYDLTERVNDYVEPGTGNVQVRTGWIADGFLLGFPWTVNIDRITLSIN